jgi:hypothetical protein
MLAFWTESFKNSRLRLLFFGHQGYSYSSYQLIIDNCSHSCSIEVYYNSSNEPPSTFRNLQILQVLISS